MGVQRLKREEYKEKGREPFYSFFFFYSYYLSPLIYMPFINVPSYSIQCWLSRDPHTHIHIYTHILYARLYVRIITLIPTTISPIGFSCVVVTLSSRNLEITLPTRQDTNRRFIYSIYINICVLYPFLYKVFLANIS